MSEAVNNGEKTESRRKDGTFAPGNPGRPKGARNKVQLAIEAMMGDKREELTKKALEMALDGDTTAMRLCFERLAPPRKDAPVQFDLPPMKCAADASKAAQAILQAVSDSELTPLEGASVMALVETYRKTLETAELEKRIDALEAKK